MAHANGWWRRRRHARHRRRVDPSRWPATGPGTRSCAAAAGAAARAELRRARCRWTPAKPEVMPRGSTRRRHRQRHRALRRPGALRPWRPTRQPGVCLMHMRGEPARCSSSSRPTPTWSPRCGLPARARVPPSDAGVPLERIVLDPGHRLRQDRRRTTWTAARQRELLALGGRCWWAGRASRPWALLTGGRSGSPGGQRRGGAGGGAQGRARRARARRGGHGRRAEGVAGAGRPSSAAARQNPASAGGRTKTDEQTYFGTDGIRGTVGRHRSRRTSCCAWAMPWAGCCAVVQAPDGADRQGHAHLGLHDRVLAGGRLCLGRCRRAADGPLPTPGVAYLTRALRLDLGRGDQRLAQPLRRQRHQVLLGQGEKAARRLGTGSRGGARRSAAVGGFCGAGQGAPLDDARGRYIEFCKSTVRTTCRCAA
jgi:hypothetical protein